MSDRNAPLLEVDDLQRPAQDQRGPAEAVRGVGFTLERGETLGLVGESGCGKSITVMSLMGLLPDSAGHQRQHPLRRQRARRPARASYCELRGNRIGMIFQEPMTALNPVHTIGRQVGEPLRLHRGLSAAEARKEAHRAARPRRHPRCAHARRRLSAPVLRRPAPAHRHRDGAGLRARPADRRRADHRARRHDPEADPRPDRRPGGRARHGADPDLARPRRDRAERANDAGDVRRQRGRERPDRERCSRAARPSLHAGPVRARPRAWRAARARGSRPSTAPCPSWSTCRPAARSPAAALHDRRCRATPPAAVDVGAGHGVRCIRPDAMAEAVGAVGA